MADSLDVALDVAAPGDAGLLANLLELYVHDLSEVFPRIEIGADGRFGYDPLPLYWSEPERRGERFEGAYAVHHWTLSWRDPTPAG